MGVFSDVVDFFLRPISREDDDELTAFRKRVVVGVAVVLLPVLLLIAATANYSSDNILFSASAIAAILGYVVPYCGWLVLPRSRMEVVSLAASTASVIAADVYNIPRGNRMWGVGVVVMDAFLVLDVEQKYGAVFLFVLLIHLFMVFVDRSFTHLWTTSAEDVPWLCDCGSPPCGQPVRWGLMEIFFIYVIVLLDLYLTRGFAAKMRQQMSVVRNAIDVAEDIAELLSMYEVDEGQALIRSQRGDKLPPKMKRAVQRLLDNLTEYQPYLPETLLVCTLVREDSSAAEYAEPPGLGFEEPAVTLCFTDVQCSTELWEEFPRGMHTALQQHCAVIRDEAKACGGYEVKVIGDAFMLAFSRAEDGCRFALGAQEALLEAKWPSDLMQHPLCRPVVGQQTGSLIWSGLRVRVGLNCGPVQIDRNPVTGRCDYFGPTVNIASRVEAAVLHGGLIGVLRAVLDAVTPEGLLRLGDPVVVSRGTTVLRGVSTPVDLYVLISRALSEREAVMQEAAPCLARSIVCSATSSSSASSASDRVDKPSSVRPVNQLSRRSTASTCAAFRAQGDTELVQLGLSVPGMLEVVEQAADATQGVVAGAMSAQCVVVWNGPRVCQDHCGQCLRAIDHVWRVGRECTAAGASSGVLLHGNISAGRRKYAMVIGGCVELSLLLAAHAARDGVAALAAATFGRYCHTQRRTRWSETLQVRGGGVLAVWQVIPPVRDDDNVARVVPLDTAAECPLSPAGVSTTPAAVVLLGPGVETSDAEECYP